MTTSKADDLWRGTSDARATMRARALTTPAQRLQWLEDSLLLAQASGALALERSRRQRQADAWARTAGHRAPGPPA